MCINLESCQKRKNFNACKLPFRSLSYFNFLDTNNCVFIDLKNVSSILDLRLIQSSLQFLCKSMHKTILNSRSLLKISFRTENGHF